ncbi:acetyl-CoA synthetase-like protein [Exidia glandulosa HHB12029]|uniref:Acetyl-CoA synthetase-like protein n=1 Tax=Exidia glandulosa HHB12029 TaxID=1314781 RepID=A0A165EG73_EXIGL|nr:acetyl-CoA synthetase-like protein [Exidia glandulosa HHB12029]
MAEPPAPGPPRSFAEAHAILTAPGALYETEQVIIDGRVVRSFKNLYPSLRAFWLAAVKAYRDKPYIVYEQQRLTYNDVHERASRLASVFRNEYHIHKGDRVAIAMRNCPEFIITFWACHLLGAVSTQVNAWLPIKPFMHCLTHSGAKVVVVDPERAALLAPRISALRSDAHVLLASANGGHAGVNLRRHNGMRLFDSVIDKYEGAPEAWRKEKECALDDNSTIFFTSGTTGLPKGVLSTQRSFQHGYLVNGFARDIMLLRAGYEPLGPPDPAWERASLLGVPLFHVTGATSALMGSTAMGFKFVLLRKWDKEKAAAVAKAEKINFFVGVPSMAFDLFESSLAGDLNLEHVGYGGAPAASTIPSLAKRAFPKAVIGQGYGLTETNAAVVCVQGEDYASRPKSTGRCAPANETIIVDIESGKIRPPGQIGELWVRGGSVMREYWNNKEETAKAITKDGWFKTGDLAYTDEDGFIYICDRAKDMIIRGGENIVRDDACYFLPPVPAFNPSGPASQHSVNVENAIYADERIHDVAVVGIPDKRLGELVGALVVPKPEFYGQVTEQEVLQRCKDALPHFAIPSLVVLQKDTIVRNAPGKIIKTEVRKTLAEEWKRRQRAGAKKAKAKL